MKSKTEILKGEVCALSVVSRWVCDQACQSLFLAAHAPLTPRRTWLSPFGLPPPLTVHPAMDDRHSPHFLTRLPHSKEVFQLLQGSTVWLCPVWLQTKHQWDSGTTSEPLDRVACNANIFHKGEDDGLRHSTFCVKLWRFATMPFLCVYLMSRHLCSLACVWLYVFSF